MFSGLPSMSDSDFSWAFWRTGRPSITPSSIVDANNLSSSGTNEVFDMNANRARDTDLASAVDACGIRSRKSCSSSTKDLC